MNTFYSPISRHIVFENKHYIVFIIHDIMSFFTLLLFFILWNTPKTKLHSFFGKFTLVPLTISIITGFLLIKYKLDHKIISNDQSCIYSITLLTQGLNIINISLNAFFMNYFFKRTYFLYVLYQLHLLDIYYGIKSFIFLLKLIYSQNNIWSEISLELLFILTIPQLLNEIYFVHFHYIGYKTNYQFFQWKNHHQLSILFLISMSTPSILFSLVHDKYWLNINAYLTNIYLRIIIMNLPNIILIIYNKSILTYGVIVGVLS